MLVKSAEPPPAFDAAKLYVWIRALEGKVNNLLREVEVLKNDFTRKQSELGKDVKMVNDDFLELRHQQEGMLQKMDLVVKELRKTAGMEEVQVLKKYLELWSPLNFVTQRDVERMVESKLMPGERETLKQKN
jgi:hypothetical protein